jgi:hypothetical protein
MQHKMQPLKPICRKSSTRSTNCRVKPLARCPPGTIGRRKAQRFTIEEPKQAMPKPSKKHAWRTGWHKKEVKPREPNQDGEMPQVDLLAITPKASREADAAALEVVQASRPLKPPGRP